MSGSLGGYRSATKSVSGTYLGAATDFDGNAADDLLWFTPSTASGDPVWFNGAGVVTSTSTVRAS